MGYDNSPLCYFGSHLRQRRRNVLIRETVKTISLHTCLPNVPGKWNQLGDSRLRSVKARVKAGDLRRLRQSLEHCLDSRQVVGLMKRRERLQRVQIGEDLG